MTEALFQFIWQHTLYDVAGLSTTGGEPVTVIYPGKLNKDAGPDFLEARVRIGDTILIGNVELHLLASDWLKHGHQNNPSYQNLILHVVLEDDLPGAANCPVLVMRAHVPGEIEGLYSNLVHSPNTLPCAGQFQQVKEITRINWLARLLAERWENKLADWNVMLDNSAEDWRNLLYWRLAANFGFKTNSAPFLMLAQSIPLNVLARHRNDIMQLEALLFGQAGMLHEEFEDIYPQQLHDEYGYLRKKYKLTPIPKHLWKFLRMRPANFPTVRIAQFAALINKSEHLFSTIVETRSTTDIEPLLQVTASGYWDHHFRFGDKHQGPSPKVLGKESIRNIIINTIAPIQFLYASRQGTNELREHAMELLSAVPPEKNNITDIWAGNGWKASNASESQALIQLYNNYCSSYRCLECAIGLNILKGGIAR